MKPPSFAGLAVDFACDPSGLPRSAVFKAVTAIDEATKAAPVYAPGVSPVAVYTGAAAQPPRTLWQILKATAEAFPRAAAIDDGESTLDYLSLLKEVRRIGHRLAAMGIGAGDRVGIRISSGRAQLYLAR